MEILIVLVSAVIVLVAVVVGYRVGRADGFNKGWKDCAAYCGGRRPPLVPPPVPWWRAIGAIKTCCEKVDECDDCPMCKLCGEMWRQAPVNWPDECVKIKEGET